MGYLPSESRFPKLLKVKENRKRKWKEWNSRPRAQGRCATRLRYAPTLNGSDSTTWRLSANSERTKGAHAKRNGIANRITVNRSIIGQLYLGAPLFAERLAEDAGVVQKLVQ